MNGAKEVISNHARQCHVCLMTKVLSEFTYGKRACRSCRSWKEGLRQRSPEGLAARRDRDRARYQSDPAYAERCRLKARTKYHKRKRQLAMMGLGPYAKIGGMEI